MTPASGTLSAATATIAANTTTSAPFTYTDVAGTGTNTVTATFGGSNAAATVTVSTGANHLVINEVDYDQTVNPDSQEYVEIYNPSAATVNLTGKTLFLVNGANSEVYATIDLGSAGSLAPLSYLVIAGAGVTVPMTAKKIDPGWTTDKIQNGAPDGMALVDTTTMTVIDALSYEGSITAAQITGFGATTVNLVEGTATTAVDSGAGALCRNPNGQDTDNAAADWQLCATLTPGTANM
ncbi:MAG: lamin tail domain-containing protein [Kofleriaceae bacterium]